MTNTERGFFETWRERLTRLAGDAVGQHRIVRGIPVTVVNTRPDIDTDHVLRRLEAALDLIAQYQPWRFRRLQHDVAQILVRRYPCRAAYHPPSRTCLVELTFLANPDFSTAQLGASIVHEAIHARLDRMGVRVLPQQKAREERLCRMAEVEFGLAVPNGQPVVERARAALDLSDEEVAPVIDWAEANRRVVSADREGAARPGKG
jgi:hypothetical protein